ncbi:MAG: hypothetical protein E7393_03645 [Ruminococcaceae bacterium]|nr:hypothetical protein [Oscillospiraceae bacterium]
MYYDVIKTEDVQAFEKLSENYDHIKKRQDYMQQVNDYYKENGTIKGFPGLEENTITSIEKAISEGQELPYPQTFFQNNKKTMDMLQKMMNRVAEKPETLFRSWHFEGGEAVVNLAKNRLQLMFKEIPSEEQRATLKKNGFVWANKSKAWQRPLTHQTMSVCDKIGFVNPHEGRKPTDYQPAPPKRNEPER